MLAQPSPVPYDSGLLIFLHESRLGSIMATAQGEVDLNPLKGARPLLAEATPETLSRLLALYPLSSLRENWPRHGRKKEEICDWAARRATQKELQAFLDDYFSCCKQ